MKEQLGNSDSKWVIFKLSCILYAGKSRIPTQLIAAIIAPVVISLVLLALGICFLRRRAMKKYNALEEQNGNFSYCQS